MDILLSPLVVSLIALVIALVDIVSKPDRTVLDRDLDTMSKFIYDLDDPDVLTELSILTDVRRLLLHMELTEGRQRLG